MQSTGVAAASAEQDKWPLPRFLRKPGEFMAVNGSRWRWMSNDELLAHLADKIALSPILGEIAARLASSASLRAEVEELEEKISEYTDRFNAIESAVAGADVEFVKGKSLGDIPEERIAQFTQVAENHSVAMQVVAQLARLDLEHLENQGELTMEWLAGQVRDAVVEGMVPKPVTPDVCPVCEATL